MINEPKEIRFYMDLILKAKAERMKALRLKNDFYKRDF
jgi:hypothetical protein